MQTRTVYTKQPESLDSLLSDLASKTALDIRKTARGLAGDKACAQEVCEDGDDAQRVAAWTVFRVTGEHRVAGGHRVNSVGE